MRLSLLLPALTTLAGLAAAQTATDTDTDTTTVTSTDTATATAGPATTVMSMMTTTTTVTPTPTAVSVTGSMLPPFHTPRCVSLLLPCVVCWENTKADRCGCAQPPRPLPLPLPRPLSSPSVGLTRWACRDRWSDWRLWARLVWRCFEGVRLTSGRGVVERVGVVCTKGVRCSGVRWAGWWSDVVRTVINLLLMPIVHCGCCEVLGGGRGFEVSTYGRLGLCCCSIGTVSRTRPSGNVPG